MLATPLSKALKTTTSHLKRLKELGIETVEDFLKYFPRTYTDDRQLKQIKDIVIGEANTVRATIQSIYSKPSFRRRMSVITALIGDETGSIETVWFNQAYIARTLQKGMRIVVSGKIKYDAKKGKISFQNPAFEIEKPEQIHTARIVPIYHETELSLQKTRPGRLSSKWIRDKLFPLMGFADMFPEFLPEEIQKTYGLIPYAQAIRTVHFPKNEKELEQAKRRLAFDELFLLQLAALYRRHQYRKTTHEAKKSIPADWELIKTFSESLPWPLTRAQKKAIYEIIKDLEAPYPMTRLLEGDVGSGKTVVAAAAILHVARKKWQACILAPTEILARQHLHTLSKTLAPFEISPALLVGSTPAKEKREILEGLKQAKISVVVGTHAVLQEKVEFDKLALAVIDEQHRFGVRQREALRQQGSPHILHLTATPIPRTLALILYGDQDLSILDEMPPGRKPVETHVVPEEKRTKAYAWIAKEIQKGQQAFIIFPLINESEVLEVKAATQEFERLRSEIFPNLKLGLLHGQMPTDEKQSVMEAFCKGQIQILVSTAVVEVGVDVPNATIMMIEGAERFGLAQLHQFRGRVGRGLKQSYCFLFPSSPQTNSLQKNKILNRLGALVKYHSGFQLAEIDLQLRGPGEVYGTAQSGIPDLKMAVMSDAITIKQSREAVEKIMDSDPELKNHPQLKQKILEQENVAIDY
ncbi:ATP-dependent DNA helicase RecG [Candidatus Peregrinibacteria bacterium]|nr:ATP-dependent DNA helicase RecG [Candidatus Peregrinibacteria bacterium]